MAVEAREASLAQQKPRNPISPRNTLGFLANTPKTITSHLPNTFRFRSLDEVGTATLQPHKLAAPRWVSGCQDIRIQHSKLTQTLGIMRA